MRDLTSRASRGFIWVLAGTGVQGMLQLVVVAVLARLLVPEDFGVVSAALAVVGVTLVVSLLGIGPAIIRQPELDDADKFTGFLTTTLSGFAVMVLVVGMAPLIGGWYRIDTLELVLRGIAPVFLLQGVAVVPEALMRRAMRFRALSVVQVISFVFGYGAIGIGAAVLGMGAWALVMAHLSQNLLRTVGILMLQPCPVRSRFRLESASRLLGFGAGLVLAQSGNYVSTSVDKMITGRVLGAHSLGVYSNAFQLMLMPATFFGQVLDDILFPLMSRVDDREERLTQIYLAGLSIAVLVSLPVSVQLMVLAPELVHVVFGEGWSGAILPLQILAIGVVFRTASRVADSLVRARGVVYRGALRHWIHAVLMVAGVLIGKQWGVPGVAAGVTGALFLNFLLVLGLSTALVPARLFGLVAVLVRPVMLSVLLLGVAIVQVRILRGAGYADISVVGISLLTTSVVIAVLVLAFPVKVLGRGGFQVAATLAQRLPTWLARIRDRFSATGPGQGQDS